MTIRGMCLGERAPRLGFRSPSLRDSTFLVVASYPALACWAKLFAVPAALRKFGAVPGRWPTLLQLQRLQITAEIRAQLRILQRQLHGCLQKSQLIPGVVRNSLVDVRPKPL